MYRAKTTFQLMACKLETLFQMKIPAYETYFDLCLFANYFVNDFCCNYFLLLFPL